MFSGLNLGLMSLTVEDLNIIIASSDDAQQIRFAKTILPMRRRGNLLLCTLLIGNTLVNVSLAVLTDPIWTYLFGTSTVGAVLSLALPSAIIVVLGEIVPQSVCSRHALSIGLSPSPSSSRPPPAHFLSLSLCWRAHTLALAHSRTRAPCRVRWLSQQVPIAFLPARQLPKHSKHQDAQTPVHRPCGLLKGPCCCARSRIGSSTRAHTHTHT